MYLFLHLISFNLQANVSCQSTKVKHLDTVQKLNSRKLSTFYINCYRAVYKTNKLHFHTKNKRTVKAKNM